MRLATLALVTLAAPRAAFAQHLAPLHDLANAPPDASLGVAGSILVTHGSGPHHLVTWDVTDDRERLDLSASPATDRWLRLPTLWGLHDATLVGARGGYVTGIDVRTGARRFDASIATSPQVVTWSHDGFSRDGSIWFGAITRFVPPLDDDTVTPMTHELLGVHTHDGSIAWRHPTNNFVTAATDGEIVVTVDSAGALVAYDIATGVERWRGRASEGATQAACTGSMSVQFVPGHLAVGCPMERLMLFDPRTGAYVDSIAAARGSLLRVATTAPDGFVLAEFTSDSDRGGSIRWSRYRSRPLARVWSTAPSPERGSSLVHTARIDDTLFVCDDRGIVDGISLSTGASTWQWGFARCVDLAASGTGRAARLYVSRGDGVSVFAPSGTTPPPEHARVEGRVTINGSPWGGARVRVGHAVASTDANGRYRVELDARGTATVEVISAVPASARHRGESLLGSTSAPVRFDARHAPYTANIEATTGTINFAP